MKKLLLLTLAMAATASSVFAQAGAAGSSTSTFTWSAPTLITSGTFTGDYQTNLSITGGVQGSTTLSVDGYDLWLATAFANSGLFQIDGLTYSRFTSSGNATSFGDTLNQTTDITSGFVRNTSDIGNIDSSTSNANAIANGVGPIQVLQLDLKPLSTLASNHTYTFFTTLGANNPLGGTAQSNAKYTDVVSTATTNNVFTVAQSSFSITTPVPEPATLSLFGLGSLGALGMTILRRRRHV